MPRFVGLCWVITVLATGVAGMVLSFTFAGANGAPQEAAGAANRVSDMCHPVCVHARACQAFTEMGRRRDMLSALNAIRDSKVSRD
jgi:hypothetical protein